MVPKRAALTEEPSLFPNARRAEPLASRMRPRSLDEFVGQTHLLGEGKPLRVLIEQGAPGSLIFWGPPGSGKTTLAHLVARATGRTFVPFSAVSEGVPRIREIVVQAKQQLAGGGPESVLFVDEIHRLNKAQQDSLLPPAEDGTICLIGATTENPSFEINGALLSRTRVFVLEPLTQEDIEVLLRHALEIEEGGLDGLRVEEDGDA